ncbi:WS_DGAT_C domain-containing protein [Pseudomonas sp. IT-232MI5]
MRGFYGLLGLQSAMKALGRGAKCTVILPAIWQGGCLHLKSPTDDMTNPGAVVNMHAVRHAASAATSVCPSSSIG